MSVYQRTSDMEIEIIYELGQEVLKHEKLLSSVSDICGELDRYHIEISLNRRLLTCT